MALNMDLEYIENHNGPVTMTIYLGSESSMAMKALTEPLSSGPLGKMVTITIPF